MKMIRKLPPVLPTKKIIISFLCLFIAGNLIIAPFVACSNPSSNELLDWEIRKIEKELDQNPGDLEKRVNLALLYHDAGFNKKAVSELQTVLKAEEAYSNALIALGYVYIGMESYEKALEPYAKLVELNKDNPMRYISRQLEAVYYYMGVAYYNLSRYQDAINSLGEALIIDKTDADAWYLLGNVYYDSGDFPNAIESFKQTLRFVPDFKETYQSLYNCYEKNRARGTCLICQCYG
ncbi:tetratricopeptide repeat protein [Chloroflexota bacterium]